MAILAVMLYFWSLRACDVTCAANSDGIFPRREPTCVSFPHLISHFCNRVQF